ncbi:MAG: hypothetical protein MI723_12340 [Caulobacterales bacterium]|nr:hypothetical protein [Caulobacterales bacterium]
MSTFLGVDIVIIIANCRHSCRPRSRAGARRRLDRRAEQDGPNGVFSE